MGALEHILSAHVVENIVTNLGVKASYKDDLIQELFLILLDYDKDKLEEIYKSDSINYFVTRVAINQYYSKTSPFYKTYRKFINKCEDVNVTTEECDKYDQNQDNIKGT